MVVADEECTQAHLAAVHLASMFPTASLASSEGRATRLLRQRWLGQGRPPARHGAQLTAWQSGHLTASRARLPQPAHPTCEVTQWGERGERGERGESV